jgi:hypothetical protein
MDQAEPYGDCLTYGAGHYETWAQWRLDRKVDPALREIVRSYEYEDWPAASSSTVTGSVHPVCQPQTHDAGNDRANRDPISFAGGTYQDPKRLSLSEHGDAERAGG